MDESRKILVAGATGYVGSQLIPALLQDGYKIRVLVRNTKKLEGFNWKNLVEVSEGDVLVPETLDNALSGIYAAYYLIHSMTTGKDFSQNDIAGARNFAKAAEHAGLQRIIYLGGLGNPKAELSEHLRSRQETGNALRKSGVAVTEFRAAIIVGAGSISFEMIRYLTERVPVMICPKWVRTRVQPIYIKDVISYLTAALNNKESENKIIDIGGSDIFTYGDMMKGYARARGLRRLLLHVPVLTPRLSSYWVHWVTPISAAYALPLIEGLRNEVIVTNNKACELFPEIKPSSYTFAVSQALKQLAPDIVEGRDCQSNIPVDSNNMAFSIASHQGLIVEIRQILIKSDALSVYKIFTELGGANGWPCNFAWKLRASIDKFIGGVGMRKCCKTRP